MKIGFYIHHTTISAGGIYTYTIGILKILIQSKEIDKIVIITSKNVADSLSEFKNNKKIEIIIIDRKKNDVRLRFFIWYVLHVAIQIMQNLSSSTKLFEFLKKSVSKINPYQKIISSGEFNLLHIPLQYSPIYKINIPIIITMHDLQEYHFPQYFSLRERLHRKINNQIAINDSDHIICSFEHVKNDIIKFFNVPAKKVSVCPPPFAEDWFLTKNESNWLKVKTKYNINSGYILYPAATWEHKNHIRLMEAFKIVKAENHKVEIICTGNKTKYYFNIQEKIAQLGLENSVQFLGIVPEEDLISLYKNTLLVVIPTLYEAGSGPLYEAMRYQVPVICSNVTSLPDTVDSNEFLFDPNDVKVLAEKIKLGLNDDMFRKRNLENSKQRVNYFRTIDYSENFIIVYKSLLSN